jgi:hypothetical protein
LNATSWLFTDHGWAAKLSLIVAYGANLAQVNSIVRIQILPTYMQFFYLLKHKDTDLTYSNSASTSEQIGAESKK